MRLIRTVFALTILGVGLLCGVCRADVIVLFPVPGYSPVTLTLVATNDVPPSLLAEDVRGINGAAVTDPSLVGLELVGNNDPSTPFPNAQLYAINVDPMSYSPLGESLGISMDFASLSITGNTATVFGTGVPLSGPISDPGLATLLGQSRFVFTLQSTVPDPNNQNQLLSTWTLSSLQVPEPSSLLLVSSGLLIITKRRFGSRKRRG